MPIQRIEQSITRLGNDEIYGNGADGNMTISGSTSLSRDMYYKNLTIDSGATLTTNGFKVYVSGVLTVNGTIGLPAGGGAVSTGTVAGTTPVATSRTNSIGGSAAGSTYTASQLSTNTLQWLEAFVGGGVFYNPSGLISATGGAGGGNGAPGTVTPGANGTGATAGGAGGTGYLSLRAPGESGGPGTNGTPGSNGQAGTTPPAASAGVGAIGGGIVFIAAKSIIGSGSIRSEGRNATAGGPSATGTGATNGAAGTAGTTAPNVAVAHHTDNHLHYSYPGGHASRSAPALPHGSSPTPNRVEQAHVHRWVHGNWIHHSDHNGHYNHGFMCPGGHQDNFTHTYNYIDYRPGIPASDFYHVNGIDHTSIVHVGSSHSAPHYYNYSGDLRPHCVWSVYNGKTHHNVHGNWPRQHHDNHQEYFRSRSASVKHVNHLTATGGAGGTAGQAGGNGTNGSTTAGTDGESGGGGGIICITDAAIPGTITTSVAGGTLSGVSGSSGMLITVLNT